MALGAWRWRWPVSLGFGRSTIWVETFRETVITPFLVALLYLFNITCQM